MTSHTDETHEANELVVLTDATGAQYVLPLATVLAGRVADEGAPALRELLDGDTAGFAAPSLTIGAAQSIIIVGGHTGLAERGIIIVGGRQPLAGFNAGIGGFNR